MFVFSVYVYLYLYSPLINSGKWPLVDDYHKVIILPGCECKVRMANVNWAPSLLKNNIKLLLKKYSIVGIRYNSGHNLTRRPQSLSDIHCKHLCSSDIFISIAAVIYSNCATLYLI